MWRFVRRRWRALLYAFTATMLMACSDEPKVDSGNREGRLYVGNGAEPQSIDPHVLSGSPGGTIAANLFEGLVKRSPYTLEIEPAVARDWQFSADRKRIVFELRPEARWSNGDPVTADDFVWSWQRALHPRTGNTLADVLYSVHNAEAFHRGILDNADDIGVTALGPHRLQVDLAYADPFILEKLSYVYSAPVHRATVEAHGAMTDRYSRWTRPGNFVGNGPFMVADWKLQRYLTVVRNPHYWNAANVALDEIVFRPIESATTEERMFRSGQLHATVTVPNSKIQDYRRQTPSPLRETPEFSSYYYLLNMKRPPLNDIRVRRAFALAVDRKSLARSVLQDTVLPTPGYVPEGIPNYRTSTLLAYDPEEARRLLAEAGYPGGRNFPPLTLTYNTSENHRTVAVAIQQMWKSVLQIDVQLANEEWKVYLDTLENRNFDIARMGWIGDSYPGAFLDRLVTGGGTNRTGFSSETYDHIIQHEVPNAVDNDALLRLYERAEELLLKETPLIPIYAYKSKRLIQPSIRDMPGNAARVEDLSRVVLDAQALAWRWQTVAH